MISLKSKKNKLTSFLKEKKYHVSIFGLAPADDWKLMLLIFIFSIGLIVASAMGTYELFSNIGVEEFDNPVSSRKTSEIEKASALIEVFEQKKTDFDKLLAE
jgi:hypothetical protein